MNLRKGILGSAAALAVLLAHGEYDFDKLIEKTASGEIILKGGMVTMTDPDVDYIKKTLKDLRDAGANHIRLNTYPFEGMTQEELATCKLPDDWSDTENNGMFKYRPWEDGSIGTLNRFLPYCEEIGLGVILNLDAGFMPFIIDQNAKLWTDPEVREKLADYIAAKARYFSNSPAVIGYDILNEPIPPGSTAWEEDGAWLTCGYNAEDAGDRKEILADFYNTVIEKIRQFDKKRLIVLQPGPWGYPAGFPGLLNVTDDERVIFSFHFYDPVGFTASNVKAWGNKTDAPDDIATYPFTYGNSNRIFDKSTLKRVTQSVVDFQKARTEKTGRPTIVWIGEFGSVRWNDGDSLLRWHADALELMDENQWGYAYFLYSPSHWDWHHFSPLGVEGDALNRKEYFNARKTNDLEYFRKMNADGPRPSFQLLLDDMNRTRDKNAVPTK